MTIAESSKRRKEQRYRALLRKRDGVVFDQDQVSGKQAAILVQSAVRNHGRSLRDISRQTGVSHTTLAKLLKSSLRDEWVVSITYRNHKALVQGLEDLDEKNLLPGSPVSVKRSRQLVLSMCAQGWSQTHQRHIIENNLGVSGFCVEHVRREKSQRISKEIEDRIVWLSQAIGDRIGPSQLLITRCRNWGYFPLKHYSLKGDLIEATLSQEQQQYIKRIR